MGFASDIVIDDPRWRRIPRLVAQIEKALAATRAQLPAKFRVSCRVTVLLTDDKALRRLNRDFRGIGRPTNVISFPQFSPFELAKMGKKGGEIHAGDIALGYQYIVEEANKDHKILLNHALHLVIHGVLHLFGYDHLQGAEAIQMERLERRIMAVLGRPDPYAFPAMKKRPEKNRRRAGRF